MWVSEPYRVLRLDPDTGTMEQVEFEALPNPTADPSAASAPLAGTWVSSFAFWDDAIWVARNNLPYLTRIDPVTMQATEELPIPKEAAGSEDMAAFGGSLYLSASLGSVAGVWVIDASGGAVALPVSARRFTASGTAISGFGGSSFLVESGSGVLADVVPEPGSPTDRFAAIPDSADLVAYSGTRNAIVRLSNEDGVLHYTGEGQVGDRVMAHGNKAILNQATDGRALRVFKGVRGTVRYLGEFELDPDPWYTSVARDRNDAMRQVIVFRLRPVDMTLWARTPRRRRTELRDTYEPVDESTTSAPRDPFTVDPDLVDRGLHGHAATQNALAAFLAGRQISARRPTPNEPDFDLAWVYRGWWYVAEVKSLTATNETKQLRLGLGQVLDYHDRLLTRHPKVRAALAVERRPADNRWIQLCERHEVTLVWPDVFDTILESRLVS